MDTPAPSTREIALSPVQPELRLQWPDGAAWGPAELRIRSAHLVEELGRPWSAQVAVLVEDGRLTVGDAVGLPVTLSWGRRAEDRRLGGVVLSVRAGRTHHGWSRFDFELGPTLCLLSLTRRSRIWQGRTAPEIVELVARETVGTRGCHVDVSRLCSEHPRLDYCVQYGETDLDFVHRLLESEGIAYRFEQGEQGETVVLLDEYRHSPEIAGPSPLRIERIEGTRSQERIDALSWTRRLAPARVAHADWDWACPQPTSRVAEASLSSDAALQGRHELHDGRRPRQDDEAIRIHDDTGHVAQLASERLAANIDVARGRSNACQLAAGWLAIVHDDEDRIDGGAVLLTRVEHEIDVPGVEPGRSDEGPRYGNRFECIRADVPYRPPLRTPRPVVSGPHTAIVIGPEGEEIHTDEQGRIQVVMHWDREWFVRGERPSCWLRVAQAWAGVGHGALFTPRVGSEVIVSFLDGDPDRPVCTGCVYNGEAAPVQSLPEHKTRSTIRTASVGGKDGFNELTFEDEAGHEEIYVHAQRNLRQTVRANHRTRVGADQSVSIGRDRAKTVEGREHCVIEGDRDDEVHGNATEVIAGSQDVTIMGTSLAGGVHGARMYVGGTYTIEAEHAIRLQCGATALELTPTGVHIYAPMVQVHGGPSSMHLLPTGVQIQGPNATVVGGQSLLDLSEGAELQGGAQTVVRHGASQLRLDGNATLEAATTAVRAEMIAELKGMTTTVEGQTVGVSGEAVQVTGTQAAVVEGGGAKATLAAGLIDMG